MAASGYAPWSRIAGIGLYGVSETLHDYLDLGAPNVLDSVTAEQYAKLAQAQAWIAATAPMFVLEVAADGSNPPTVTGLSMASGYATYTGDSPPAGFPAVEYVQAGEYTVIVAASYSDDAAISGAFDPTYLSAGATDATSDTYANLLRVSGTELTLYHRDWSSDGALAGGKTSLVEIG